LTRPAQPAPPRAGAIPAKAAGPWPSRLALAAIVVASALIRLRIAALPLERDEGEYAYFGQLILRGEWPYVAAYNMKLPGIYYTYAAILALLGQTDVAIRVALLLVNAATIVLVAALARRFVGAAAALTAAAAYAVLSLGTSVVGFTANAEHFVLLPALAGLLLLQDGRDSTARLLGAGLLLGIGVVMKQPGAFFVACGAAWILVSGAAPVRVVRALALFGIAAALPYALTCLAMLAAGAFEPFWFWTVVYLREYGTMLNLTVGLPELYGQLGRMLTASPLTWLLAAAGVASLATRQLERRSRLQIVALVATSAATVVPGLRFTDHYFLLVLPALSVLAALGADGILLRLGASRGAAAARIAAAVLPLLIFVLGVAHDRATLLVRAPAENARAVYGVNPLAESIEIAQEIARRAAPDDQIAVIGSEPQIYFYARRRAATGFVYMYPLMEPQPFARQMQRDMIAQLERARPRFLVLVNVDMSWSRRPDSSLEILDWAARTVDADYRQIGLVEIPPDAPSRSVWGDGASSAAPHTKSFVAIFERRT
jgi:4-amino-4-deoxy-L-arabinose transferase-like glycosyltransferase